MVIIGGGMVGATMALALSELPVSIAVIEAFEFSHQQQPSFDDRSLALSLGSVQILKAIDLWQELAPRAFPIEKIHVSDKGHFGFARMDAQELQQDALGFVIETREAGKVLYQQLKSKSNITLFCPASYELKQNQHKVVLDVSEYDSVTKQNQMTEITAQLLIGCDGSQSALAKALNIETIKKTYEQQAIIANIELSKSLGGWAYERFTDEGPVALLPLSGNKASLVWTVAPIHVDSIMKLEQKACVEKLQSLFGFRAGKIKKIGQMVTYPLSNQRLSSGFKNRVVFIGNALHTGHPVAGQGFNLGLRDVAELAQVMSFAVRQKQDLGNRLYLDYFWQNRLPDIERTLARTDALALLFANNNLLLKLARNFALKWLDIIPPVKKMFARQAMGLFDDLPALARGVRLNDHPNPIPVELIEFGLAEPNKPAAKGAA